MAIRMEEIAIDSVLEEGGLPPDYSADMAEEDTGPRRRNPQTYEELDESNEAPALPRNTSRPRARKTFQWKNLKISALGGTWFFVFVLVVGGLSYWVSTARTELDRYKTEFKFSVADFDRFQTELKLANTDRDRYKTELEKYQNNEILVLLRPLVNCVSDYRYTGSFDYYVALKVCLKKALASFDDPDKTRALHLPAEMDFVTRRFIHYHSKEMIPASGQYDTETLVAGYRPGDHVCTLIYEECDLDSCEFPEQCAIVYGQDAIALFMFDFAGKMRCRVTCKDLSSSWEVTSLYP